MATTLVSVEERETVRCNNPRCALMQFRPANSLCRRCHQPLEAEAPTAITQSKEVRPVGVADRLLRIRRARHLSQRQLAGRMQVPRTYISKIENGRATPTLGSLARLANALGVGIGCLVHDEASRREEETAAILADPFLADIASLLPHIDGYHRTLIFQSVRGYCHRSA